MKLLFNPPAVQPDRGTPASLALTDWYRAHPAVRRLWAIEEGPQLLPPCAGIHVLVMLEPTPDGDETSPVWFANGRKWIQELQAQIAQPVLLKLLDEPLLDEFEVEAEGILIAMLCWRDPSTTSYED